MKIGPFYVTDPCVIVERRFRTWLLTPEAEELEPEVWSLAGANPASLDERLFDSLCRLYSYWKLYIGPIDHPELDLDDSDPSFYPWERQREDCYKLANARELTRIEEKRAEIRKRRKVASMWRRG